MYICSDGAGQYTFRRVGAWRRGGLVGGAEREMKLCGVRERDDTEVEADDCAVATSEGSGRGKERMKKKMLGSDFNRPRL